MAPPRELFPDPPQEPEPAELSALLIADMLAPPLRVHCVQAGTDVKRRRIQRTLGNARGERIGGLIGF